MNYLINLIHIFIFAPLLLWVSRDHSILTDIVRVVVGVVSVGVFYHHFNNARTSNSWISWFHVIVVAPLLALIAWKGTSLSKNEDSAIMALAVAAVAIHAWRLYEKIM
jgi:sensor histidine kinase regulating citrate/malate metabolism